MSKISFLMLIIIMTLLLVNCESSTSSDDKVTYSGTVKLIDLEGNEIISHEVTVAVFEKEATDIAWDYRLNKPLLLTYTDNDGKFSYSANDNDNYVVVFLKEGYSIKEINQNELNDDMLLYENHYINGIVDGPIALDGSFDLIISGDTFFIDSGSLIVTKSSKIRIETDSKVIIYSMIDIASNLRIMSNDKVYSFGNSHIEEYHSFTISQESNVVNNELNNLSVSNSRYGFIIEKSNLSICECQFYNSKNGLYIRNSNSIGINDIIGINIEEETNAALHLEFVNDVVISNSRFIDNFNGIKAKEVVGINMNNCSLSNNNIGYYSLYSTGIIEHNELFSNSQADLNLIGNKTIGLLEISYNNFCSDTSIVQSELGSYWVFYQMAINFNNFKDNNIFIKYDSSGIFQDIDATNNYFDGLNSESAILERIIDNSPIEDGLIDVHVVPFKTSPISSAGVTQE